VERLLRRLRGVARVGVLRVDLVDGRHCLVREAAEAGQAANGNAETGPFHEPRYFLVDAASTAGAGSCGGRSLLMIW
jgi:hypothetical protein